MCSHGGLDTLYHFWSNLDPGSFSTVQVFLQYSTYKYEVYKTEIFKSSQRPAKLTEQIHGVA